MTDRKIYYFDNNATTRIAPEVVEAMLPFLRDFWGNPSSAYSFGAMSPPNIDRAREKVAALIDADPREIVFTSCGTESNNAVLESALATAARQTPHRHHGRRTLRHHQTLRVAPKTRCRSDLSCRLIPTASWICICWINPSGPTPHCLRHVGQ